MPTQLTFDLPMRPALGRDDYFVSPENEIVVATISDWRNWPDGKLVLCGPPASGKTHLMHVWAADAGARVLPAQDLENRDIAKLVADCPRIAIEDVDKITGNAAAQNALFHLHNLTLAEGGRLLLSGQLPPALWPLTLPDLKSRILGAILAQLNPPDEALLSAVMVKLFADRQVDVAPDAIGYIAPRMERSFDAAGRIVTALDAFALAHRRAITRPLTRDFMDRFPEMGA